MCCSGREVFRRQRKYAIATTSAFSSCAHAQESVNLAFRRFHLVLRRENFYTDADIKWFPPKGATLDWADGRQRSFACLIGGETEPDLFVMFNADTRSVDFAIPALPSTKIWRLAVDTSRSAPDDLFEPDKEPSMQRQISFRVEPRSSAILLTDDHEVLREN